MVEGWLDKGYVLYLRKTNNIEIDGWYWEEQRLNTPPHDLNKTKFIQLINLHFAVKKDSFLFN